jgi:hypothetical protein
MTGEEDRSNQQNASKNKAGVENLTTFFLRAGLG